MEHVSYFTVAFETARGVARGQGPVDRRQRGMREGHDLRGRGRGGVRRREGTGRQKEVRAR
jgi:hypothetical protein